MTLRPGPYLHLDAEHVHRGVEGSQSAEILRRSPRWVISNPAVTAAVVGPRRPEHLEPALRA